MGEATIRVLVIHECPLVCASFRHLLESQADLVVVGEAPPGTAAVDLAQSVSPDVILFDPIRQGASCLDLIPVLAGVAEATKVIIVTRELDREFEQQAVELGARGLVDREQSPADLFKAVRRVYAGELWFNRKLIARVLLHRRHVPHGDPEHGQITALTAREREVITLLGTGLKNKQIAERLAITETTVRHHLTAIFAKLGVTDRVELLIYAYRHGLASPPV